jgi:hypothetical protein
MAKRILADDQARAAVSSLSESGDTIQLAVSDFLPEPREMHTAKWTGKAGADPHFELSMICCAFLIADSSGALSFFRMSIVFCAEAVASFLLPSFA